LRPTAPVVARADVVVEVAVLFAARVRIPSFQGKKRRLRSVARTQALGIESVGAPVAIIVDTVPARFHLAFTCNRLARHRAGVTAGSDNAGLTARGHHAAGAAAGCTRTSGRRLLLQSDFYAVITTKQRRHGESRESP
jgi:hypothetical protein